MGAVVVIGVVVVAVVIAEELEAHERRASRERARPESQTRPSNKQEPFMPGRVAMRLTRREWWHNIAQRREQLFLKLIEAKASYQDYKRAVLEQEKELLREARTPTAKEVLTEAYMAHALWEEFGPLLRRCQRLGFADLGDHVHVACLFVQALPRFPKQARQAFAMLAEVEGLLGRVRKGHSGGSSIVRHHFLR